ncbi:hypothetical protein C9427_30755 [Mesorhizobium helmanticense]|uniref:Histidine kinase/HSP90-like ATPase domain-containing protein n=2 Tax=Mesorhizobium helmanticense TaxID=1776423 RepID=A0A2T4ILU7_9HYPH|nr:hypothetical protein C9427_30755 [Mesorhizobium helmanticense]
MDNLRSASFRLLQSPMLEVVDNERGMLSEILEKATVPFSQAHTSAGLTGCAQLVNTMRGKFRITSTPGIGTLVSILLPISANRAKPS